MLFEIGYCLSVFLFSIFLFCIYFFNETCLLTVIIKSITVYISMYSQTCVKQAPMGKPKYVCLRQVLA